MNNISNIVIIPARGGSKGVPKKNIKVLGGKPLIGYSIEHALNSSTVDKVFVSTDCEQIAAVSKEFGADVIMRPEGISGDFASSEDALLHVLEFLKQDNVEVELVTFLQCTSPIREPNDIDDTVKLVKSGEFDSALTVVDNHRFLWRTDSSSTATPVNYDPHNRKMRQEISEYQENGSIYVMKSQDLINTCCRLNGRVGVHIMKEETGYEIDTHVDFEIIEKLMGN